jgi:hypothetical protein
VRTARPARVLWLLIVGKGDLLDAIGHDRAVAHRKTARILDPATAGESEWGYRAMTSRAPNGIIADSALLHGPGSSFIHDPGPRSLGRDDRVAGDGTADQLEGPTVLVPNTRSDGRPTSRRRGQVGLDQRLITVSVPRLATPPPVGRIPPLTVFCTTRLWVI